MARKASRRTAAIGAEESLAPVLHRETPSEGLRVQPFSLLKSSPLRSMENDRAVGAASDNGISSIVGEANGDNEFNDFIECLGYPPPRAEKRVERRDNEEFNDFIECLGYPPRGPERR